MADIALAISSVALTLGVINLVRARRAYHRTIDIIRDRETWR